MNTEQALRQSLELLALRVTSNRGGYPRHEPVPSDPEAIAELAQSLDARLIDRGEADMLMAAGEGPDTVFPRGISDG